MYYKFINRGTKLKPVIYMYDDNTEKFLGGFTEMLIYMLHLEAKENIIFENFNLFQMNKIKESIKKYNEHLNNIDEKIKNATHIMIHKDTRFLFLDNVDINHQINEISASFKTIDTIECRRFGGKKVVSVSGMIERYGIKNEHGFYDMESNEFFTNEMIEPVFDTYDEFEDIYEKYKVKEKII